MRINSIKLVNFSSIFVTMNIKELYIDLSKQKSRIILFLGDNGSGKTSILSNLHPFAYPGSMDIRNNTDLILADHDGRKEIEIYDKDDVFNIVHIYKQTPNGMSLKSFIKKNGNELNPNGNVTSFKEMIELQFQLELDFMKLLRLGSNVTSFMKLKDIDRKKFISNLLSDIDVYTPFFKKINDDFRYVNNIIKETSSKLSKLNIDNKDSLMEDLSIKEKEMKYLDNKKNDIISVIGSTKGQLSNIYDGSIEDLREEKDLLNYKITQSETLIISIEKKISKLLDVYTDLDKGSKELAISLSNVEKEMAVTKATMDVNLIELNSLYIEKENKENNLKYIDSDKHIENLKNSRKELCSELSHIQERISTFKPSISKDEAMMLVRAMQEIKDLLSELYSYSGKDEIKTFLTYINEKRDCVSSIKKKISIIEENMLRINMQLNKEDNDYGKSLLVMYAECDKTECPYMTYYNNTQGNIVNKKDELKSNLVRLDNSKIVLLNILEISSIYKTIMMILKHNNILIHSSIFKDMINEKLIIQSLEEKGLKHIIGIIDSLTTYISLVEDCNDISELENSIHDLDSEISIIENNSKSLEMLKEDLSRIYDRINELNESININRLKVEDNIENISSIKSVQSDLDTAIENQSLLDSMVLDNEKNVDRLKHIISIEDTIKELYSSIDTNNKELKFLNESIEKYKKYIDEMIYRLRQYDELESNLLILQDTYDDLKIIRESLSTGKGMPLLFVKLYLKNTRKVINELLYTVYKGSLEVEEFIIEEDVFKIPYSVNNITVSDITHSSQGETSLIEIALSFALIEQSLKLYDILLLDEIDATLDKKNRSLFLNILETYLDKIGCEQVFMITHNDMFDNYNVDAICTSDHDYKNYKKLNILYRR